MDSIKSKNLNLKEEFKMKIPSIYDFNSAMAVMILKNLAHLKHKEKYGQLTPQEMNMIYDTVHHHELCMEQFTREI